MPVLSEKEKGNVVSVLKNGGVAVIPTDTVYGLVGSALSPAVVGRIYKIRKRDSDKPLIILLTKSGDVRKFGCVLTAAQRKIVTRVWPGRVSVILPCPGAEFAYLHRGRKTLAFRLPDKKDLLELLQATGPLVAPSANPQGLPPPATIAEARAYFGDSVDWYQDGGTVTAAPSRIIDIAGGGEKVVRDFLFSNQ